MTVGPVPSRREALALGAGAAAALALSRLAPAAAQEAPFGPERHGMSAFDDLAYPEDFRHFAYVNPAAPKAGTLSQTPSTVQLNQNFTTFNSLQMFILKGDGAAGLELTFASLMARALDEPDAMYGLAAQSVAISQDGLLYRFRLRPEARFHDGSRVTAEDAAWSIATLKAKGHPLVSQSLREVEAAEALDPATLVVRFAKGRPRDLPLLVAGLPILSRAYYASREFDATTLEPPLGSGPYRVGRFESGRFIEYERIAGHWSEALPVSVGQLNFNRMRYEFFRDREVAFEAFKGAAYLFREEFTSRVWARQYDFAAVSDGRIRREVLDDDTPSGAQGWFFNVRRPQFQDPRVREALILAFDFEWTNKNLMFDSYERTHSFFQNSDLMAEGPPSAEELAVLEPFRGRLPDEVFGEPFVPPVSDGSGQDRRLLRRARELLQAGGWRIDGGQLKNARGERMRIEFLDFEPSFEPHTMAYIKNLRVLGIEAEIRRVDPAQYQARSNAFDFDVTTRRYSMSSTPGEGLRLIFGSEAAATPGSRNLSGMADPAIDALVEKVIEAGTRHEMTIACRALDRVIRAGRYWVPHWSKGSHWLAYWDAYARPEKKPRYGRAVSETWWWDEGRAQRAGVRA